MAPNADESRLSRLLRGAHEIVEPHLGVVAYTEEERHERRASRVRPRLSNGRDLGIEPESMD